MAVDMLISQMILSIYLTALEFTQYTLAQSINHEIIAYSFSMLKIDQRRYFG